MKKYKINPTIPLLNEEKEMKLKEIVVLVNIAYVLADAVHSFYIDAVGKMDVVGLELKDEDKHNFLEMKKSAQRAKFFSHQLSKNLYGLNDSEDALHDSDWFYNLVKLVHDRLGEDKLKTHQFLEFLSNMPSEGFFKIGIEDFQRL